MALRITIKVTGDKKVMRKLAVLRRAGLNMPRAMDEIGEKAIDYYGNDAFATRGRVYGGAWQELTPAYKKWKEKNYAGRGILQLSGEMQGGFFARSSDNKVTIDNRSPIYKYHQSSAPRTKMPRRQMAGVNEPIKRIVKEAIRRDITRQLSEV